MARELRARGVPEARLPGTDRGERPRLRRDPLVREHGLDRLRATVAACRKHGKPYLIVEEGVTRPSDIVAWLEAHQVETLNVAGNRESKNPGLGQRVEAYLSRGLPSPGRGAGDRPISRLYVALARGGPGHSRADY